jgi:hypothetical protein
MHRVYVPTANKAKQKGFYMRRNKPQPQANKSFSLLIQIINEHFMSHLIMGQDSGHEFMSYQIPKPRLVAINGKNLRKKKDLK